MGLRKQKGPQGDCREGKGMEPKGRKGREGRGKGREEKRVERVKGTEEKEKVRKGKGTDLREELNRSGEGRSTSNEDSPACLLD